MQLCDKHPYIRSRVEQEEVAFKYADDDMGVAVLELPYIFGTQPADALFGLSLLNSFKDLKKCLSLCIQREALQCLQFARLVKLL